jgi:hypothetical protein
MNLSRFRHLLDAWGSDIDRWPRHDQEDAERLLGEPAARKLLGNAQMLERALLRSQGLLRDSVDTGAVDRMLLNLQSRPLPRQRGSLTEILPWPFDWPQLATLAGGATLGILLGLSSLGLRMISDLEADRAQITRADTDLSAHVFDTDTVTGLRP